MGTLFTAEVAGQAPGERMDEGRVAGDRASAAPQASAGMGRLDPAPDPGPLAPGFADPARDGARAFRVVMEAVARPGQPRTVAPLAAPAPLSTAAATVLLVLTDRTTPLHLAPSHDTAAVRAWVAFHTGAPLVAAGAAQFALGRWDALQPVERFAIGTPDYPDRSATLIVEMDALDSAAGARLTGPGIRDAARLALPDAAACAANHARYPLGWDAILTCGAQLAGLPRSTAFAAGEGA